jgi:hypothetical protein
MIGWENEDGLGVGKRTLGHDVDVHARGGTQPYSLAMKDEELGCI